MACCIENVLAFSRQDHLIAHTRTSFHLVIVRSYSSWCLQIADVSYTIAAHAYHAMVLQQTLDGQTIDTTNSRQNKH